MAAQQQQQHQRRRSAPSASSLVCAFALALCSSQVEATPLTIRNQCEFTIDLWDNHVMENIAPGANTVRVLPAGYHGMFRHGVNPQATLAEFSTDGGMLWYDISIIPTGPRGGPEYCPNLDDCKARTGGVGYNVPMQIAPRGCKTLTCMGDGCPEAYQYPKDDGKTTACNTLETEVDLIFCPGGTGGATPAPTTPAPTTPAPTTPAPTTPAPATIAPAKDESDVIIGDASAAGGADLAGSASSSLRGSDNDDAEAGVATKAPTASLDNPYMSNPAAAAATPIPTTIGEPTVINVKSEADDSGSPLATVLSIGAGVLACVAAAFIFVAYRKRKQLEALEPKDDSMLNHQAMVTPQAQIHIL